MNIENIRHRLAQFAKARNWDQFHSPKNLSMALAAESAELLEIFQWLTDEQSRDTSKGRAAVTLRITPSLSGFPPFL